MADGVGSGCGLRAAGSGCGLGLGLFGALRAARSAMDAQFERWTGSVTKEQLEGVLRFRRGGAAAECPLWWAVAQVFNHQTHHRGQITTLLTQAGQDVGATDLFAMLREESTKS